MAKFKTPIKFKGEKEGKTFEAGEVFEVTIARAEEIQKNIKDNYNVDVKFERIPEAKKEIKKEDGEAK